MEYRGIWSYTLTLQRGLGTGRGTPSLPCRLPASASTQACLVDGDLGWGVAFCGPLAAAGISERPSTLLMCTLLINYPFVFGAVGSSAIVSR